MHHPPNHPQREAWYGREHDRYSADGDERRFTGGYGISGGGFGPSEAEGGWLSGRHPFDPDYARWRYEHIRSLDADYDQWRQTKSRKFSDDFEQWRQTRYVAQTAENEHPPGYTPPGKTPEERASPVHHSTTSRHM